MSSNTRRKVTVECPNCRKEFETTLRWEGVPEKDFCTKKCETDYETYESLYSDDNDDFDYTKFRGDW